MGAVLSNRSSPLHFVGYKSEEDFHPSTHGLDGAIYTSLWRQPRVWRFPRQRVILYDVTTYD